MTGNRVQTWLSRSVLERTCCPYAWLRAVAAEPYPALLESSLLRRGLGRFSLLCWAPFKKITVGLEITEVKNLRDGETRRLRGDPFPIMSAEFAEHRFAASAAPDLPFAGGAVGYFSYDLRHRVERLPTECDYDVDVPYAVLCFYDHALVFDHDRQVTEWVTLPGCNHEPPQPSKREVEPDLEPVELESNFAHEEYLHAIRRAKEYIAAGDIFQVNLAQRFSGACDSDGVDVYGRLRSTNPAPFSGFLRYPEFEIISSSPERFLLVEGDTVTTRPIKGTRPRRAGDEAFNERMRQELLGALKDHAELTMIVDLERNDLGRVCRYGSVKVTEHAVLEAYQTVFHLVSTVQGELHRPEQDEFSLIKASFPGGSITGAPKIRAMEIIEELEPHARAVYTGSMGYLSFHGRMDLNIAIRTMLKQDGRVYLNFGGGLVADSVPELEYEETLHKGKALFEALGANTYSELIGSDVETRINRTRTDE